MVGSMVAAAVALAAACGSSSDTGKTAAPTMMIGARYAAFALAAQGSGAALVEGRL